MMAWIAVTEDLIFGILAKSADAWNSRRTYLRVYVCIAL